MGRCDGAAMFIYSARLSKIRNTEKFHDHIYAGHMGHDDTRRNIKKSFYYHNLYSDVAAYVATCCLSQK